MLLDLRTEVAELRRQNAANDAVLQQVLGEVTRIRVEQRADALGPEGLLKKLRTYAPLVASARVPEPDYLFARRELDAILTAFAALGNDAWKPVTDRLTELDGEKDYDEARYLLRAAMRIDARAGAEIVKNVLAGARLPSPRLRWDAANILIEMDRPLAQRLLRHIMTTESSRGANPDRRGDPDVPSPAMAATTATGFHNFVALYVKSDDPKLEETLLMVLGRAEHDVVTIQECIKVLGERRCERAVPVIEKLYRQPPGQVQNPLFLNHCLTALHLILGPKARPFLEEALRSAPSDLVTNHCKFLLGELAAK
ncbi:MAG: hypothetical protein JNL08_20315 [Planctomycetes bacterium]|nr:hypothetical protein [Planctomycetota bacterium]